jgi:hypothetical protein
MHVLKIVLMFHLTCLGWMLFRSPDWATVQTMSANLFYFSGPEVYGLRIAVVVVLCALAHGLTSARPLNESFARASAFAQGMVAGAVMLALVVVSPGVKPFIYFRF